MTDYLQAPPHLEKQTTQDDLNFVAMQMQRKYLMEIRNELCKLNPSVLCTTVVEGGPIIGDGKTRRIWFETGGKPVTIYKLIYWAEIAGNNNPSITFGSMSTRRDGFATQAFATILQIEIDQLMITKASGSTQIGVNLPTSQTTDGSVFIYGFTTPYQREDNY